MGKLIVIEGTDGTGKSTQFAMLTRRLKEEGTAFRRIQFPQYLEPSSALIHRMQLPRQRRKLPAPHDAR